MARILFILHISQLFMVKGKGARIVLLYHNPDPSVFESHLRFIKANYSILPLSENVSSSLGPKLSITFDDAYRRNCTEIYPLLKKHSSPAAIFVATSYIGGIFWLEALKLALQATREKKVSIPELGIECGLKTPRQRKDLWFEFARKLLGYRATKRDRMIMRIVRLLKVEKVSLADAVVCSEKELMSMLPLVELGAHTVTHPDLVSLGQKSAYKEIGASKSAIERITGRECIYFAYPFGKKPHFNEKTGLLLKQQGLRYAFTTIPSWNEGIGPFEIGRIGVGDNDSVDLLCLKLSVFWPLISSFGDL